MTTMNQTSVRSITVADLSSPVELNATLASDEGTVLTAECNNEYTVYTWHSPQITANSPYIVNGAGGSGSWVASGGKYVNSIIIVSDIPAQLAAWGVTSSSTINYDIQNLSAGPQTLVTTNVALEMIAITAAGAVSIEQLSGASAGAMKILLFDDANTTMLHDAATPKIILQGGVDATFGAHDILMLINRGGSQPGTNGYWREIWRSLYNE
jgi:hypothetical protein